mgnify:CR=1 FL=1
MSSEKIIPGCLYCFPLKLFGYVWNRFLKFTVQRQLMELTWLLRFSIKASRMWSCRSNINKVTAILLMARAAGQIPLTVMLSIGPEECETYSDLDSLGWTPVQFWTCHQWMVCWSAKRAWFCLGSWYFPVLSWFVVSFKECGMNCLINGKVYYLIINFALSFLQLNCFVFTNNSTWFSMCLDTGVHFNGACTIDQSM